MAIDESKLHDIANVLTKSPELWKEGYPAMTPKFGTGNIELLLIVSTFLGRMGKEAYDQWKLKQQHGKPIP